MLIESSLTILFEDPFWIGLYERIDYNKYEVCKITFGSEPKDYEVHDFLLKNWHKLRFSPPIKTDRIEKGKINPKRMQREINSQLENKGIGTKAQQALKLQHEKIKLKERAKAESRKKQKRNINLPCSKKKRKRNIEGSNIMAFFAQCKSDILVGLSSSFATIHAGYLCLKPHFHHKHDWVIILCGEMNFESQIAAFKYFRLD